MKKNINKIILATLLLLINFTSVAAEELSVIDLSDRTLGEGDLIELDENWKFYWQQYLFSGDSPKEGHIVGRAKPWTAIEGDELPIFGYGTYAVTVKLPKREYTKLSIKLRRVKTAFAVYVDNTLIGRHGELPNYPISLSLPVNDSGVLDFDIPLDQSQIDLFIHVANDRYYRGGLDQPPQLGYSATSHTAKMSEILWAAFISGALLFMGIYHFGLWLKRRSNTTSLYFSIFSIVVGVRSFFTYKLVYLHFPNISEATVIGCETTLAYTALPFLHIFISSSFPQDSNKYLTRLSWITWIALMLVCVGTNLKTMGQALAPFQVYFVITLFHMIYMGIVATMRKREGSLLFSFGFIVALIMGVHDVLFYNNDIRGMGKPIFPFGVLVFIFIQFVLHSMRFSRAYRELENLTNTLEQQVQERTKELSQAHKETKLLSMSIINLLEDERKSIARELHDDFGQSIRAAGHFADNIARKLESLKDKPEVKDCISNANEISKALLDVYQKNRNLLRRLRPEIIDTLGLEYAIEELLDNYRRNDFIIEFVREGNLEKLDSKEKITIYRVLQEAITNILKYAETNAFSVFLKEEPERFVFSVKDYGKGFDPSTARGVGLISMRERMAGVGGSIEIQSEHNKGTSITAYFPKH